MKFVTPEVYLIATPQLNWPEIYLYLDTIDGMGWAKRNEYSGTSYGELLCEFMGRLCYNSFEPGLNPNVTKIRNDTTQYLQNIIGVGHGSVLEHAQYSFVFDNVSRVFTHELVRHRAGVAISQESLRFVRLDSLNVWLPDVLANKPDNKSQDEHDEFIDGFVSLVERLEDWQLDAADYYGLDEDGVPFHYKKTVTSAMRRLAPIGLATRMGWSANIRTLRHVIEMRTAQGAEQEIRLVFDKVGRIMQQVAPALFDDYTVQDGVWIPGSRKV